MFIAIMLAYIGIGLIMAGIVIPIIIALIRPNEAPKKTLVKGRGGFYRYNGRVYRIEEDNDA